jgi:ubiquinone/menaquinone biosynthesis C-methylase UbiE
MERNKLAEKYLGETARTYNARRSSKGKWRKEQTAIDLLFESIPHGSSLVDVPVGTGRFLELCKRREIHVTGIDISEDMLAEARKNAMQLGVKADLRLGNIFELPFSDNSFDCALCVRFLNWISIADVSLALAELSRVSKNYVIVGVRTFPENQSWLKRSLSSVATLGQSLYSRKRNRSTTPHRKANVIAAFNAMNLDVVRSVPVHSRPNGTRLEFYLLSKTGK